MAGLLHILSRSLRVGNGRPEEEGNSHSCNRKFHTPKLARLLPMGETSPYPRRNGMRCERRLTDYGLGHSRHGAHEPPYIVQIRDLPH